jgi:hypothetical protein
MVHSLAATTGSNIKFSPHSFPCVQIWKIQCCFFSSNWFTIWRIAFSNLGWVGFENRVLWTMVDIASGRYLWRTLVAHQGKSQSEKARWRMFIIYFVFLWSSGKRRWRLPQFCCPYMPVLMANVTRLGVICWSKMCRMVHVWALCFFFLKWFLLEVSSFQGEF